jgi:hypothetical protein
MGLLDGVVRSVGLVRQAVNLSRGGARAFSVGQLAGKRVQDTSFRGKWMGPFKEEPVDQKWHDTLDRIDTEAKALAILNKYFSEKQDPLDKPIASEWQRQKEYARTFINQPNGSGRNFLQYVHSTNAFCNNEAMIAADQYARNTGGRDLLKDSLNSWNVFAPGPDGDTSKTGYASALAAQIAVWEKRSKVARADYSDTPTPPLPEPAFYDGQATTASVGQADQNGIEQSYDYSCAKDEWELAQAHNFGAGTPKGSL